jgi:hypothetical protein
MPNCPILTIVALIDETKVFAKLTRDVILGSLSLAKGLNNFSGISISAAARSHMCSSSDGGEQLNI